MKRLKNNYRLLAACVVLVLGTGLIAWNTRPDRFQDEPRNGQDTIPAKKKNANMRDLDREIRALEEGQSKLEALRGKDWDKVRADVEDALKKIETGHLQIQIEEAMRQVDFEKIQRQVEEAMKKVDLTKMQQDIQRALEETNKLDQQEMALAMEKAQKEVKESLSKINWEKIKKEVEETKKLNSKELEKTMKKAQEELKKARTNIQFDQLNMQETLKKAKKDIEKGREELKGYQEMIYAMEQEGLLNTKEDYRIEYDHGDLYINRLKQSPATTAKYKKYFPKEAVIIRKTGGEMSLPNY